MQAKQDHSSIFFFKNIIFFLHTSIWKTRKPFLEIIYCETADEVSSVFVWVRRLQRTVLSNFYRGRYVTLNDMHFPLRSLEHWSLVWYSLHHGIRQLTIISVLLWHNLCLAIYDLLWKTANCNLRDTLDWSLKHLVLKIHCISQNLQRMDLVEIEI